MQEIWKQAVGHEGYYEVSNTGMVRTDTTAKSKGAKFQAGKILKQHLVDRYLKVFLCGPVKKWRTVHTLVLEAFVGPRPKGCVSRHIDGNGLKNVDSNLTWGTQKENIHDKQRHGTQTRGVLHGTSKVSVPEVKQIRKLRSDGFTIRAITDRFQIGHSAVHNIVRRKTWRHV